MSQFNKSTNLFIAIALCGATVLPMTAQAAKKRSDAAKVVDTTTLPARKVVHTTKKDTKKTVHFGKKMSESAEHRVGHVGKQIFR